MARRSKAVSASTAVMSPRASACSRSEPLHSVICCWAREGLTHRTVYIKNFCSSWTCAANRDTPLGGEGEGVLRPDLPLFGRGGLLPAHAATAAAACRLRAGRCGVYHARKYLHVADMMPASRAGGVGCRHCSIDLTSCPARTSCASGNLGWAEGWSRGRADDGRRRG